MATRHQATLFLPEPAGGVVDEVRSTWDPEMARRIAAHLTLVHDASPVELVIERLQKAAAVVPSFRLMLGAAACWGSPERGIYREVSDLDGGVAKLRKHVMIPPLAEPAGVAYEAHVTLVHPRTVDAARCRDAWEELRRWGPEQEVVIDAVTVIRGNALGWVTVETIGLQ